MTRIVCDTMIWYNLSKGNLKIPDPEKYTLVCTYLTLMELAFTPNNFRKLNEVQDTIREILKSEPELILAYPFNYARTLIDHTYNYNLNIEEDLVFAFLRVLLNHPKNGLIDNKFKEQLAEITNKRKGNSNDWADFLNKLNEPSKEISWVFKKYKSDEFDNHKFQKWFLLQVNQISDRTYTADNIDWKTLSFTKMYLNVIIETY